MKMTNENIKEKYNTLIKTEMYKEFIENNPDYNLSNAFIVFEQDNCVDVQIGFYSEKADKVVSFDLIKHKGSEPEDAMKRSGTIPCFEINDFKIEISEALKICDDLVKEKYSQHTPTKKICILQIIEEILLWNITYVTDTLYMINMRVNANTGKIIKDSANSIMSLGKKD
jgi:hypothetical protein